MRLYHGSKSGINGEIAPNSRSVCDFGRGFYMGTDKTQPLTLICHGESPKFYEIDYEVDGLRVHQFEPNLEWAECEALRLKSENQRSVAVKMVDRIRLMHRRDGMSFQEIVERDTGRPWDAP
jgi:hypothetical protein